MIKKKYLVPTLKVVKLKHAYYLQCGSANLDLGSSNSNNGASLGSYSSGGGDDANENENVITWGN